MSRSTFPNQVDSFPELFDLPADQINNANKLMQLKAKSTLTSSEQNTIMALEAQLQDYMITPEVWNKLADCMVALETFFNSQVKGYIEQKQREWAGYVRDFHYVGDWANQGKYKFQNLVAYRGHLFLVLKDVVADNNHLPDLTPDTYRQVAFKGDKGDIGLAANYKGNWNGSTSYQVGDAVYKDGVNFVARVANQGKEPNVSSNEWFPYQPIMVGRAIPTNLHPQIHYYEFY